LELHRLQDLFEGFDMGFLRHQPDHGPGVAIIAQDVMAAHGDGARRGLCDAADRRDQRRLAGTVGTQKRDDLALADGQVDAREGLEPVVIAFPEIPDLNDIGHHCPLWR
jgi:hypothetical protein